MLGELVEFVVAEMAMDGEEGESSVLLVRRLSTSIVAVLSRHLRSETSKRLAFEVPGRPFSRPLSPRFLRQARRANGAEVEAKPPPRGRYHWLWP